MTQKHRHWFGKPRYGNCFLFCAVLFLLGRLRRLKKVKGHWMGQTRFGTWVHLKDLKTRPDRCRLYWGRPHAFKRSE